MEYDRPLKYLSSTALFPVPSQSGLADAAGYYLVAIEVAHIGCVHIRPHISESGCASICTSRLQRTLVELIDCGSVRCCKAYCKAIAHIGYVAIGGLQYYEA